MTNEEILDELLHEAYELRIRDQVLDLATIIRDQNNNMSLLQAVELAMQHIKNHS